MKKNPRIVIAPDSFKESLSAAEVANAIERGIHRVLPGARCIKVPMADGGEGTTQALVEATGGKLHRRSVHGPLGDKVRAAFGVLGDGHTAAVEMAAASGLMLVPPRRRNPMKTSTFGTGELLASALRRGATDIIVGLGGSATNDGGAGMAQALGYRFYDQRGRLLRQPLGGGGLARIARIDADKRLPALADARIRVACDVTNPLTGRRGASAVFGPQKGATPAMVKQLDDNLRHFARLIRRDLGRAVTRVPGAGAAGGLGAGLLAFTEATMQRGIELVIDAVGLAEQLRGADLVITGEGRIDEQTPYGKTPAGVASLAGRAGVPVIAIGGSLGDSADAVYEHGIDALEAAVARVTDLDTALSQSRLYLERAAERIARLLVIGGRIGT